MILADVMDEIGDVAETIPGLHVYRWPVDEATPPAAWPTYPVELGVLGSFQRGTMRWQGGLIVAVGRIWDRATRDQLSKYVSDDGPESITAAFYAHDWQACAYAQPVRWRPDAINLAGVDLMAAVLDLDIAGPGLREG